MEPKILNLCNKLDEVANHVIAVFANDSTYVEAFGWMAPAFTRKDLATFASDLALDLRTPDLVFTPDQITVAERILPKLDNLKNTVIQQTLNGGNSGQSISAYVNTMLFLRLNLLPRLPLKPLDWQSIEDQKQFPPKIVRRVIAADKTLSQYEPQLDEISEKIDRINTASNLADDLPIVLDQLREAREAVTNANNEITELLQSANSSVSEILTNANGSVAEVLKNANGSVTDFLSNANGSISELVASAKLSDKEIKDLKKSISDSQIEAQRLVVSCEEAYRITTTKGLAAAFELKAKELQKSLWIWVVILIVALLIGGVIGSINLNALTHALGTVSETGEGKGATTVIQWPIIVVRLILSLFSVSAPLWLAWLSTKQISQRFKLAEDYAFKASISKAYEGYRKEAVNLDTAFASRLFGSALTRLDEAPLRFVDTGSHGSPWHELANSDALQKLFDKVPGLQDTFTKAVSDVLEAGKSAIKMTGGAVVAAVNTSAEPVKTSEEKAQAVADSGTVKTITPEKID